MKIRTLASALCLCAAAHAATVTISDTIVSPFNNQLFNGVVGIYCPQAMSPFGIPIGAQRQQVAVVNGALTVQITPYDASVPRRTCTVSYSGSDSAGQPIAWNEQWFIITSANTLKIADVLVSPATPQASAPSQAGMVASNGSTFRKAISGVDFCAPIAGVCGTGGGGGAGTGFPPTGIPTSIVSAWGPSLIFDTDTAMASNSDTHISSQKATKAYIDSGLAVKQPTLGFVAENAANKGVANGYASLDSGGKVPVSQLPTGGSTQSAVLTFSNILDATCPAQTFSFPGVTTGIYISQSWPGLTAGLFPGEITVTAPDTVSVALCNLSGGTLSYSGTVIASTGTGGGGSGMANPTTTTGDIIYRGVSGVTRLGIGTEGQFLKSTSGIPTWGTGGGGGGASTMNDLLGCTPTIASGHVVTLPTTCALRTGVASTAVAVPASFTVDVAGATNGWAGLGFDGQFYYLYTNTTGYSCGTGSVATCTPATSAIPNGVVGIAHFTIASGAATGLSLDLTLAQQKIIFSGANASDSTDPSTGIRTVGFAEQHTPRVVAGTSDTLVNSDCGNEVIYTSGSSVATAIGQAGTGGNFLNGCRITFSVQGAGTVTITPATSTIRGSASQGYGTNLARYEVVSNGTNYY